MERGVERPIGDAEGALAEDGFQLVATQRRACRQHAAHVGPRLSAASLDIGHHALLPPKHDSKHNAVEGAPSMLASVFSGCDANFCDTLLNARLL